MGVNEALGWVKVTMDTFGFTEWLVVIMVIGTAGYFLDRIFGRS
jgi:hypothetical protein